MTNFKSFPLSSDLMSVPDQHFAGIAGGEFFCCWWWQMGMGVSDRGPSVGGD